MKIIELKAYPTSFPVPPEDSVTLGIGRAVKRDAVVVKVTTDDGVVGWGESHDGRAPGAVAHLVNTTLRQLVLGMDAADVVGGWGGHLQDATRQLGGTPYTLRKDGFVRP